MISQNNDTCISDIKVYVNINFKREKKVTTMKYNIQITVHYNYNAMIWVHGNGLCYKGTGVIKGQFYKGSIGK